MVKLALLARLEAKPGKEQAVEDFIKSALALAVQEEDTVELYALRLGPSTFGVFDTFEDEKGRQAHLDGPIAKALMEKAPELLSKDPMIEPVELLAVKWPAGSVNTGATRKSKKHLPLLVHAILSKITTLKN